jgi:hypothetical protein
MGSTVWEFLRNVFRQLQRDLSSTMVEFTSPYSPDECVRRMSEDIGYEPFFWYGRGTRPMMGRVWKNKIWVRKRVNYRNGFQTWMTATFEPQGLKTRIRCQFGVAPATRRVMIVWLGFIGSIGMTGLVVVPIERIAFSQLGVSLGADYVTNLAPFAPILMFAAGIGIVRLGRHNAQDEQAFLTDLLKTKLKASQQSSH